MTRVLKHNSICLWFLFLWKFFFEIKGIRSQGTEGDICILKEARNWRLKTLRGEELHNLCFSPNIITLVK